MEKEENQNFQSEDNNDIKKNKDTVKTPENKDLKPGDKIKLGIEGLGEQNQKTVAA